jgi:hypothetical protein
MGQMRAANATVGKIKRKDYFGDMRIILHQILLDKQVTTVVT